MHQHRPRGNGLWWVVRHICHMYPRNNLLCIMLQIKKIKCIYWTVIVNRFNSLLMIIIALYKYLQSLKKSSIKKETLLFDTFDTYYIYNSHNLFIHVWYRQLRIANIIIFFSASFFWNFTFCLIISIFWIAQIHLCNLVNVCSLMYSPYTSFFFHILRYMYFTLSLCIIILT